MIMSKITPQGWMYTPADIYIAPLTASAIKKQEGRGIHERFSQNITDYVRYAMDESSTNPLNKYAFNSKCAHHDDTVIKTQLGEFRPDFMYDDGSIRILGESKVNLKDLKNPHTVSQLAGYVDDLLSVGHVHKDKFIVIMTPFNLGAVARHIVNEDLTKLLDSEQLEQIHFLFASEIDGHFIAAPKGWENIDFGYVGETTVQSRHYGIITVKERWVKVNDPFLKFDSLNSRLVWTKDKGGYTQDVCWKKLLEDGDAAREDDAIARRGQMTSGSIKEPIWITEDGVIHEGNSRVAYARHLIEITNGQAPGYEWIKVYEFPPDVTPEIMEDLKQEKQSSTILGHGRVHDAMEMWRRVKDRKQDPETVAEVVYGGKYSVELVEQAVDAVDWLMKHGYSDEKSLNEMYYVSYALSAANWNNFSGRWIEAGITRTTLTRAIRNTEHDGWRQSKNVRLFIPLLNDSSAPSWKIQAIKNFISQQPHWSTVEEWTTSYEALKAENSAKFGAGQILSGLKASHTNVGKASVAIANLRGICRDVLEGTYENDNWTDDMFSKNKIVEIGATTGELSLLISKLQSDCLLLQSEYVQAKKKLTVSKKKPDKNNSNAAKK